jgi:50S ribosomal protein L16 3-hydroxylase
VSELYPCQEPYIDRRDTRRLYNASMKKLTLLGGLTPAQFMRDYWHKKPLLIRQALPGFSAILSKEELFELASREEVESRLILRQGKHWDMAQGPFSDISSVVNGKPDWTLLTQGVNLHHHAIDTLLRQFRFIPDARLDDVMISYAVDGGGVGPHIDSYDVFLLQAHGKRRWRIGPQKDPTLVKGLPLKVLQNFMPEQDYLLEPGDMLYLPPNYAHEGVAVGDCMTYSIGFKAPAYQELGEGFLQFMADSIDLQGRYADPDLKPTAHPAQLGSELVTAIATELEKVRFSSDDITIFIGQYLSEPKALVRFSAPIRPLNSAKFFRAAAERGIVLSLKTQMLYRGRHVFINGESFAVTTIDRALLYLIADHRAAEGSAIAMASSDVQEALHLWYLDGWLSLGLSK